MYYTINKTLFVFNPGGAHTLIRTLQPLHLCLKLRIPAQHIMKNYLQASEKKILEDGCRD